MTMIFSFAERSNAFPLINTHLSKGLVPYKCAALFTSHVQLSEMTAREKNATNRATIGSSPQKIIGIDVGRSNAKIVYNTL